MASAVLHPPAVARWGEALESWLAEVQARSGSACLRKVYGDTVKRFLLDQGGAGPGEVSTGELERWAYRPLDTGAPAAPATIRNRLAAVTGWYRFLVRHRLVADNPGLGIPRPKHRPAIPRGLSKPELAPFVAAPEPETAHRALRTRAAIVAFVLTALRLRELSALTRSSLEHRSGKWWYLARLKGGKHRRREWPEAVHRALTLWLDAAGTPFDSLAADARLYGLGPDHLSRTVRDAGRRRGFRLKGKLLGPHVLRHTAAKLRKEAGRDIDEICELLGHENPIFTMRYLKRLCGEDDPGAAKVAELLDLE